MKNFRAVANSINNHSHIVKTLFLSATLPIDGEDKVWLRLWLFAGLFEGSQRRFMRVNSAVVV